jgi:hypothetical protein
MLIAYHSPKTLLILNYIMPLKSNESDIPGGELIEVP